MSCEHLHVALHRRVPDAPLYVRHVLAHRPVVSAPGRRDGAQAPRCQADAVGWGERGDLGEEVHALAFARA